MSSHPDVADSRLDPARTAVMRTDWLPGYELLSVVGTGGFGTIYKARQLQLDRVVALKVVQANGDLNPAVVGRFEAEALMHGKLHHPNIVEVYDSGRHGNRMFIAMELLEGRGPGPAHPEDRGRSPNESPGASPGKPRPLWVMRPHRDSFTATSSRRTSFSAWRHRGSDWLRTCPW